MNALPSSQSPLRPVPLRTASSPRRRSSRLAHRQRQRQSYQTIALEAGVKLTVNVVLGITAISALITLIPYNMTQQAKLEDLREEVDEVQRRVAQQQTMFHQYFDPQQTRQFMPEFSGLQDPSRRPVQFTSPPAAPGE